MNKILIGSLLGALLAFGMTAPSMAQMYGNNNPQCGYMANGQWMSNGNCDHGNRPWADGVRHNGRLWGTIVAVSGHMVTIRSGHGRITFNDGPALNQQMTGRVRVGRTITANGYWRNGTFRATSIQ